MQRIAAVIAVFAIASFSPAAAFGDEVPSESFFILMRAPDLDPAPRFVSVFEARSDALSEPIAGCDGQTYYATYDDASIVNAALANGNTVELARGDLGVAPQDAPVACLIQASP